MRKHVPKHKRIGPPQPKLNYRYVTEFLLKPLKIGEEERWLETATWYETYRSFAGHIFWWEKLRWVDPETEIFPDMENKLRYRPE